MKKLLLGFMFFISLSSFAQEQQHICSNEYYDLIENALIARGFSDVKIRCIDSSNNPLVFISDAIKDEKKSVVVEFSQGSMQTDWSCLIGISSNKVESITDCSGEIQDMYFNN